MPSVLGLRLVLVDEDTLAVGNIESSQIPFANCIQNESGAGKHLLTRDAHLRNNFLEDARVFRGIELEVETKQFANGRQFQRGFWVSEALQNALDSSVNVGDRPGFDKYVFRQPTCFRCYLLFEFSLRTATNPFRIACSSGVRASTEADLAA